MHWLWVIIIGFIIGVIAKFFRGGKDPAGFIVTIIIGILGSVLASWVGGEFGLWGETGLIHFIAAIVGAMVLLVIYHNLFKPKAG